MWYHLYIYLKKCWNLLHECPGPIKVSKRECFLPSFIYRSVVIYKMLYYMTQSYLIVDRVVILNKRTLTDLIVTIAFWLFKYTFWDVSSFLQSMARFVQLDGLKVHKGRSVICLQKIIRGIGLKLNMCVSRCELNCCQLKTQQKWYVIYNIKFFF